MSNPEAELLKLSGNGLLPVKSAGTWMRDQSERVAFLRSQAQKVMGSRAPLTGPVAVEITYRKGGTRADSANILGGVADALEGIVYEDDRQVSEWHYREIEFTSEPHFEIAITPKPALRHISDLVGPDAS
jgi:Holliday junction resolvase RusA-like endonuclease